MHLSMYYELICSPHLSHFINSVTLYKYAKLQSNTQKQVPTENDNGDIAEFQGLTAINRSVISTDQPLTEVSAP